MRAVWVAMSNVFFYNPLGLLSEWLVLLCLVMKVRVYMVGSWTLLSWQIERRLSLLRSAVTGFKTKCWPGKREAVSVWKRRLPVRDCHCKLLSSWSAFRMEFYCWEWILQFGVGNMWNAAFVSFSAYAGCERTDAVVHRSSLWRRLLLVVPVLPGQVSTAVSCDVLVLCHHVANALPVGFLLSKKGKDLTDHLAKHQESI